jgi:hypothetical protein
MMFVSNTVSRFVKLWIGQRRREIVQKHNHLRYNYSFLGGHLK